MDIEQTLLLVDDNELVREALRETLQLLHPTWQLLEASNGAEGVALAKAHRPDIIFMDMNMPILNGYGAIMQIRAVVLLRETPIILMTSEDMQAPLVVQASALCQAVLEKPFSFKEMNRLLASLLGTPSVSKYKPLFSYPNPLLDTL